MNPKASSILEKARDERRRSQFKKALARVEEGIEKFPKELRLYTEAIDVAMEAGESLKAIQNFKRSQRALPDDVFELWTFTVEKVATYNDPIVGRFMIEHAIRSGDLPAAHSILQNLGDDAAGDLLERMRTKKKAMSAASGPRGAGGDEVVAYALAEALIHLRLGRLGEAAEGLIRVIEENPGRSRMIEPFLLDIEKEHGSKGEAVFAVACCHLACGRIEKALENLMRAARRAPALTAKVIEKIESMDDHPELPLDRRHLKLAELHRAQGDNARAAVLASAVLERNRAMAGEVVEVLKPAVESAGGDLAVDFVFIRAASAAGMKDTALSHLRKIHRLPEHKSRLIEWMEAQSQSDQLSAEFQLFFAETALSEGLHGKAVEILKELLSRGVDAQGDVRDLLSRYQSVPFIQQFYNERFGASSQRCRSTREFERYDDAGFSSAVEPLPTSVPSDEEDTARMPAADFASKFETTASSRSEPGREPENESGLRSDFDNNDFSLSMHAPADSPGAGREDSWGAAPEAEDSDLFDYLKRDFSQQQPSAGVAGHTEPGVSPDGSGDTGDVDSAEPGPAEPGPDAPARDLDREETVADLPDIAPSDLAPESAQTAPEPVRPLDLAETAYEEGRLADMKRLLDFEPANLAEDVARKHQLARYYLGVGLPLAALIALKSVQPGALSRSEKKTFMLLVAQCYKQLHNFEAAHGVYLRIMNEHPGDRGVEAAARANYTRYVEAAAGAALTLEKLTNL